jgi:hypothetical protein
LLGDVARESVKMARWRGIHHAPAFRQLGQRRVAAVVGAQALGSEGGGYNGDPIAARLGDLDPSASASGGYCAVPRTNTIGRDPT